MNKSVPPITSTEVLIHEAEQFQEAEEMPICEHCGLDIEKSKNLWIHKNSRLDLCNLPPSFLYAAPKSLAPVGSETPTWVPSEEWRKEIMESREWWKDRAQRLEGELKTAREGITESTKLSPPSETKGTK